MRYKIIIWTIVFACLLTVSVVSAAENVTDDIKNNNFLNVNEDVNLSCSIDNSNDILLKNNEIESDFKYSSDNEDSNNVLGYSNNESDSLSRVWVDSDRKNWVHVSNQVTYDYNDYFTFSINYPFDGEAGIIKEGSDGTSYEYFTKITDGDSEKSTNIDLSRLSAGNYVFFVYRYDFTNYHPEWGDGYRYSLVSVSFNVLEAPKSNVPIKSSTSDNSKAKSTKVIKSSVSLSVTKKTFKTTDTKKKCDVTLKCKNKAIKNAKITLKVNGKTYKTTTNSKGIGTFKLTKLTKSGNYKATFSFAGKGNYAKVSKNVVLTVSKVIPKLTAKDKTFNSNDNIRKYTVTLKTNKNKVMSKSKITLKINGVTYTAKTNSKGVATFKLTKLTKGETYSATVKFAGNKNYKSISKNVKINVKKPTSINPKPSSIDPKPSSIDPNHSTSKSVVLDVIYSDDIFPNVELSNNDVISTNYEKYSGRQWSPGVYARVSYGLGLLEAKHTKLVKCTVWFSNGNGNVITKSSTNFNNYYIKVDLESGYTPYKAQIWYDNK